MVQEKIETKFGTYYVETETSTKKTGYKIKVFVERLKKYSS